MSNIHSSRTSKLTFNPSATGAELASSIPHVVGACIWLPYFDIALYINYVCQIIAFINFQEIKEIFTIINFNISRLQFYLLFSNISPV